MQVTDLPRSSLPGWLQAALAPPPEASRRCRTTVDALAGARVTVAGETLVNFAGNDYLGLAGDAALCAAATAGIARWGVGGTASHLLSGHTRAHQTAEEHAAAWLGFARALLFSSGYLANLAVVTALAGRGATLYADRLNHACLNDAARLSGARLRRYRHADLETLAAWLAADPAPQKWVLTDAVFSMDGDIARIDRLLDLCRRFDAMLLIDDAHGFGVLGGGRGTLHEPAFAPAVFRHGMADPRVVLMVTLGKAAGAAGALLLGAAPLIEAVVQRGRSYIYTTALPPSLAEAATASLQRLADADCDFRRAQLLAMAAELRQSLVRAGIPCGPLADAPDPGVAPALPPTPIVPVLLGSDARALAAAAALRRCGVWVPAIRPPTVPAGTARLRVSLSAGHGEGDLAKLINVLKELFCNG
ncbi:MAG: 8-amino-7-oxononanoate synthase [Rhodocyclaceae bacterium]|nr:8-amino-7-oxononanoate synthase [Rhodocyclaceae bacterium]